MKFFHLADLHIGKNVNGFSMTEDQKYILAQITEAARKENPDAIIMAGDIYDKPVPPVEAVTLFDSFLTELSGMGIPVLVISGNHDSAERLAFASKMLRERGVYISPVYDGKTEKVSIKGVNFYMLPFVKPAHVRQYFPDEEIKDYSDACRVAVNAMNIDPAETNVLIAHQSVTGASTCDSEDIFIGGTENVGVEVFDRFDYVALGHLHGPQNITPRIRYSGTPLKYSCSEKGHHKSITVVEMDGKNPVISTIPLTPLKDLREVKGKYDDLVKKENYDGTCLEDYIFVRLLDEDDVFDALNRLRAIYPNIMELSYENRRTKSTEHVSQAENVPRKTPLQLLSELYEMQNGGPMSEEQKEYSGKLLEELFEKRKEKE